MCIRFLGLLEYEILAAAIVHSISSINSMPVLGVRLQVYAACIFRTSL